MDATYRELVAVLVHVGYERDEAAKMAVLALINNPNPEDVDYGLDRAQGDALTEDLV